MGGFLIYNGGVPILGLGIRGFCDVLVVISGEVGGAKVKGADEGEELIGVGGCGLEVLVEGLDDQLFGGDLVLGGLIEQGLLKGFG
jgi:hypothetical protein